MEARGLIGNTVWSDDSVVALIEIFLKSGKVVDLGGELLDTEGKEKECP